MNGSHLVQRFLVLVHRYAGLVLALLLVPVGVSGALIVYFDEIDRTSTPALRTPVAEGPLRMEDVIRSARAAVPTLVGPTRIQIPSEPGRPVVAAFTDASDEAFHEVMVDPVSAQVLHVRDTGDALVWQLFTFHAELYAGPAAPWLMGAAGFGTVLLGISGLYLWWPRRGGWKRAFRVRRGDRVRFNYDLHRVAGTIVSLVALELGLTGLLLTLPDLFRPWLVAEEPPQTAPAPATCLGPADADRAIAIASERFPGARVTALYPPRTEDGVYRVGLRQPDELAYGAGATRVAVDPRCSTVNDVFDPLDAPFGERIFSWLLPLHSGQFLGALGRALTFVVGLAFAVLAYTGFVTWLARRRMRRPAPAV